MKQKLAILFNEDNINSRLDSKIFNYSIITLIILSSIQIVIELSPEYKEYKDLFVLLERITIIIFTVEYIIRFWLSGILNSEYQGIRGKLKYFFSFYALIDFIAIVPFYVSFLFTGSSLAMFRIIRILRVLRLARYLRSFDLIVKAAKNKKVEMMISMQFVLLLTFVLSVLMYHVENKAQPENFTTIVDAMMWSLAKFIGDIAGFGNFTPITLMGKVLATFVGFLGIAVFAIPAGIIASGFVEEIEIAKRIAEYQNNYRILKETFQVHNKISDRKLLKEIGLKTFQKALTVEYINTRIGFSNEDIFNTIKNSDGLRLRTVKRDSFSKYEDVSVIEFHNSNRIYGSFIKRDSEVIIISTQNYSDVFSGHFTYSLASYLNASYISNEYFSSGAPLKERQINFSSNEFFLNSSLDNKCNELVEFKKDINNAIPSNKLVLYIGTAGESRSDIHILFGGKKGEVKFDFERMTYDNSTRLEIFYNELNENAKSIFNYNVITHEEFPNDNKRKLSSYVSNILNANIISIFINVKILRYSDNKTYYRTIKLIGDSIKKHLL